MGTSAEHLLVVDDNEMNRDMLSRRLTKKGYRVSVAADGREALRMITSDHFDLILLDIMMPDVSGLEVLREVRTEHSPAELPIIMATAKDTSEDVITALKMGANDYVTKPLDFPVVLARCNTHLSLSKATTEIKALNEQLEARNRFIRRAFGRYVSDDVVRNVLDSPGGLDLGGEKRIVTLMMADLRGFAAMCERLDPQKVVRILNLYLGGMTDVITRYGGTIDEFIGDGIFVMFGAPVFMEDHARRAVECALSMQLALGSVNDRLKSEGLPEVKMGIGIHTGEVVVGNVGSDKRAKFGAIGRNVNVTGRIETYSIGGQVLVSESTCKFLGDDFLCRETISIEGKGLRAPIEVFDVRGLRSVGLHLEEKTSPLRNLAEILPISFVQLDGKHVKEDQSSASIVRLSKSEADIESKELVPLWANLRIHLQNAPVHEAVYAKVVQHIDGRHDRFRVRFTSSSEVLVRFIEDAEE